MALTSARLQRMSLDTPEEVRPFEEGKGKLELVNLAGGPVGRATFDQVGNGRSTSSPLPRPTAVRQPTSGTSFRDE